MSCFESILDYAVSSYTPNIASLTNRVQNNSEIASDLSGLFLTSHPNALKQSPIPETLKEVQLVHDQVLEHGARVQKVDGSDLTIAQSLEYMKAFSCIHLACHASQNLKEPLQSKFVLHNGPLALSEIIQQNFKNADLAFLSACQTCTRGENLHDEAVHLAAGMLAAGYRRVVATMWPIKDCYAPGVAKDFYSYLLKHQSGSGFDGSQSAYALHFAIQELRKRIGDSPDAILAWAPYVHFGL